MPDNKGQMTGEPRLFAGTQSPALGRSPPVMPAACALFLDVDGTLLDLAPTPEAVVVPPDLLALLLRLQAQLGGALALVSGRALASIDSLFAPVSFTAAGQHGAELRFADQAAATLAPSPALLRVRVRLPDVIADLDGAAIEDKGLSIALHYRQNPTIQAPLYARITELLTGEGEGLSLLHGKQVYEIRGTPAHKGRAVEFFMQASPFAGRQPVYIGDDLTDADGFEAAKRLGGHAIAVGERFRDAESWLPSPTAVREWLSRALN
jgi:trehalose 6-phosphate phosphatase